MKNKFPRRQFLRGSSFLLAVPMIESMVGPLLAQSAATAKRFVSLYFDMGMSYKELVYPSLGSINALPSSSTALSPFKNQLLFLQNMKGPSIPAFVDAHLATTAYFLTGYIPLPTQKNPNPRREDRADTWLPLSSVTASKSIDQIIADSVHTGTSIKSIHLGASNQSGGHWQGLKLAYGAGISWKSANQMNVNIDNPKKAFDNYFLLQNNGNSEELTKLRWQNKSVLDAVLEDFRRWENKLSGKDREDFQAFADGVRAFEVEEARLNSQPDNTLVQCASPLVSDGLFANMSQKHRLYMDIISLAFKCDLTRVATVSLAQPFSDDNDEHFNHINNSGVNFHLVTHSFDREPYASVLKKVEKDYVQTFAYLLDKIKPEMNHTAVLFGSGMGRGDHRPENLPVILASGNGINLKKGQSIRLQDEKLPNLHLTLQKAFGISNPNFYNSNKLLPILT